MISMVVHNGKKLRMVFQYEKMQVDEHGQLQSCPLTRNGKKTRVHTVCTLLDEENNVFSCGESFCSLEDEFNRDKGRKYALRRALNHLPKSERNKFWFAYFSRGKTTESQVRALMEIKSFRKLRKLGLASNS